MGAMNVEGKGVPLQGGEEAAVEQVETLQGVGQTSIWQERPVIKEGFPKRKRKKRRFRISACIVAKVLAFLLFVVTFFIGGGLSIFCLYLESEHVYDYTVKEILSDELYDEAEEFVQRIKNFLIGENIAGAVEFCENSNASAELWYWSSTGKGDRVIWSTWDGNEADIEVDYHFTFQATASVEGHVIQGNRLYLMRVHIDPAFSKADGFREAALPVMQIFQYRYEMLAVAVLSVLLCILCIVFLICGAGRRNSYEGVVPGVLTGIWLDVLAVIWGTVGVLGFVIANELYYYFDDIYNSLERSILFWGVCGTILAVWALCFLIDFVIRLKMGGFWKHTLVYRVLRGSMKGLCCACKWLWGIFGRLPMVMTTVLFFLGFAVLEFFGIMIFANSEVGILWFLEKLVIFPLVMYVALACKKLQKAGEALADGQENYQVDTSKMLGAFKAHGENLNSIGEGISRAVEARMRSEHMKTELITNVSHDIKTPLTSIINYADLICEENSENEKIAEYSEVLLRQSKRLKKLLEDLVDASKATTGNLEVNLQPCEVGVLLTQAVGEYEQKMAELELNLIVRQPEEPIYVMADGRHLWRVFDNLLNNICKYAQEGSRVYLNLESRNDKVVVTFRNMSKYALDISPEELEERFVRGDKSRHMEGNGLGLSIAKSLVELQNGEMEIVIDGDLFKVLLVFSQMVE